MTATQTIAVRTFALGAALLLAGCNSTPSDLSIRQQGDIAFESGDLETARAEYSEYIRIRPGRAEIYYKLGVCDAETGRPEEALHNFRLAFEQEPENELYVEALAQSLYEAGENEDVYDLLRWRTEQPGLSSDYIRLGRFAAKMGDVDEAEIAFRTAAKVDGGRSVEPHLALAEFYRSIGDSEMELLRLKMALYVDLANEEVNSRVRALGLIPGPTLSEVPEEMGN